MVVVSSENIKKQKKDEEDASGGSHTEDASPKKNLKLSQPLGNDPLAEPSQDADSQDSQDQSSQDSVSRDEDARAEESSQPSCQQQSAAGSHVQDQYVLALVQGIVFPKLLDAFSQEELPEKITFNGEHFNLTEAFDEFWKTFYNSSNYSEGHEVKIPKVGKVTVRELKSLVKILKRGWEDERYWPKKLARPLLETCLFREASIDSMTPEALLKFIDAADRPSIDNKDSVDQNMIDVFKKYCSVDSISIRVGDNVRDSCAKVVNEIMVVNMNPVIDIWRQELTGLMPERKFDFLMKPIPEPPSRELWDDLDKYSAPHELWQTFLYDWPEDKVKFYYNSLINGKYASECNRENCSRILHAKHFLCVCDNLLDTLRLERHDAVLEKLLTQIDLAIEAKRSYFSTGNNWKVLTSRKNEHYEWPEEMSEINSFKRYPHIVVYSVTPEKRVLIVEHSVCWEHWIGMSESDKSDRYMGIKNKLESLGFEVEYRVFDLGSRGVLIPDLYKLFEEILGMKHSEISKAHEEISQVILSVPYESSYYEDLCKYINK